MKKRRGNSRFFVIFVTVIAAAALLYKLIMHLICNLDIFDIKLINFSGNTSISNKTLVAAADSLYNKNLFSVSKNQVKQIFSSFSRIEDTKIDRKLPNTLNIHIKERIPVFHLKTSDGSLLSLDRNACVISEPENGKIEQLPFINPVTQVDSLILGQQLDDPLLKLLLKKREEIISREVNFFNNFSEIYLENDDLVFIEAKHGFRVVFAPKELIPAALEYEKIKNTFSFDSKTTIDMRKTGFYRIMKSE